MQKKAWPSRMIEAVILNEKIRRPAPKGFSSLRVIRASRKAHGTYIHMLA